MEPSNQKNTKTFRLQNKKLHLTYPSHIDPQAWISWMTFKKKKSIKYYSIVHEIGKDNYKHTHILVEFVKVFQSKKPTCFDWPLNESNKLLHPNIKIIKSKKHWINTSVYHYKQNDPYTNFDKPVDNNPIKDVWEYDNLQDALVNTCTSLNNVGGVIAAFKCKPKDYGMEPKVDWNPWQQELMNEIENEPNDRNIIWYYDEFGSAGKSFLCKHMGMYRNSFVSTKAKSYHVATMIKHFLEDRSVDDNTYMVLIFNFTRQKEQKSEIYDALEELKDGMITSEKYIGETTYLKKPPHIICLANYLPDVTCFSNDRWDIRALQDKKVVRRYVSGKIIYDSPDINPFIDYKLSHINDSYNKLINHEDDPEFQQYLIKIKKEKEDKIKREEMEEKIRYQEDLNDKLEKQLNEPDNNKKITWITEESGLAGIGNNDINYNDIPCPVGYKRLNGFCELPISEPIN